jgi:hypothetical protein
VDFIGFIKYLKSLHFMGHYLLLSDCSVKIYAVSTPYAGSYIDNKHELKWSMTMTYHLIRKCLFDFKK